MRGRETRHAVFDALTIETSAAREFLPALNNRPHTANDRAFLSLNALLSVSADPLCSKNQLTFLRSRSFARFLNFSMTENTEQRSVYVICGEKIFLPRYTTIPRMINVCVCTSRGLCIRDACMCGAITVAARGDLKI